MVWYLIGHIFRYLFSVSAEDNLVLRFRGNLVVDGGKAFDEEEWTSIKVGDNTVVVGDVF